MRIVKLSAENVKRLRAVEIKPDGSMVVVSGRNGQGKSSVLDSIWLAAAGGEAKKGNPRPIRDGEKSARVTLDLGDMTVERRWTANDKSYLSVTSSDGAVYKSPQQLLDGLVGRLSFDPLRFAELPEKEQRATLLELTGAGPTLDALEAKRAATFAKRTEVNREVKRLEGALASLPTVPGDTPDAEVSVAALTEELAAANQSQRALQAAEREQQTAEAELSRARQKLADLKAQMEQVREAGTELAAEYARRQAALEQARAALVDTEAIEQRLREVDTVNTAVRAKRQRESALSELATVRKNADVLSLDLDMVEKRKQEAIESAAMPIDGLGFDADGVTFGGVPFAQCSSAERLRVSLAIAMRLNPKLRVIRITDGSLLDEDSMALVKSMAEANDFQVWIEVVDSSGEVGVYIEDGQVGN